MDEGHYTTVAPAHLLVCKTCGCHVINQSVHDRFHGWNQICSYFDCRNTEDLKMCGSLGERCPDHFVEP